MTNNKKCTRYYSGKQERDVAKKLKGKTVANSGAAKFVAGDVNTDLFLLECKTKMKDSESFTIKKEWFTKNKEEAFAMGKLYNAVVIDFGDNENHYIINESLFKYLNNKLMEDENYGN